MQELISGKLLLASKTRLCPEFSIKDDSWEMSKNVIGT